MNSNKNFLDNNRSIDEGLTITRLLLIGLLTAVSWIVTIVRKKTVCTKVAIFLIDNVMRIIIFSQLTKN